MNRAVSLVLPVRSIAIVLALFGCLLATSAAAQIDTIVNTLTACEAGSGGIGPSIGNVGASATLRDVGFRFTVPPGMGGTVTDLTICGTASDAPYDAPFALYSDAAGTPDAILDTFEVSLLEDKGFSSTLADVGALLRPGRSYWIVALASTDRGAWWRAVPDVPGQQASREDGVLEWTVEERPVTQMRVRALPEPGGAVGAAIAVIAMAALRRAASSRRGC